MKTYLFDDKRSVWHAVMGFISAVIPCYLGIPVIMGYAIYEVMEPENPVATVGDLVEFIIGFMIGVTIRIGG